jgi:hypothetical protein
MKNLDEWAHWISMAAIAISFFSLGVSVAVLVMKH